MGMENVFAGQGVAGDMQHKDSSVDSGKAETWERMAEKECLEYTITGKQLHGNLHSWDYQKERKEEGQKQWMNPRGQRIPVN